MVSESFQELRAVDAASTAATTASPVPGTDSHPYTGGPWVPQRGWPGEDWRARVAVCPGVNQL